MDCTTGKTSSLQASCNWLVIFGLLKSFYIALNRTYNNDSFSKRNVYFKEFEHAINYCRENGNSRKLTKKMIQIIFI